MSIAAALLLSISLALPPASAQNAPSAPGEKRDSLRSTEQALKSASERAAKLARDAQLSAAEIDALRQHLIAVAARANDRAATVARIEKSLSDLSDRESAKQESLKSQRSQLASLIAALQRIATHGPTALIALPAAPADTIRSALLLRSTVPAITAHARILARDLDALTEVRTSLASTRLQLGTERNSLQHERTVLETLIDRKAAALAGTRSAHRKAAKEAAQLGREARSLRELVARLETARQAARREASPSQTQLREDEAQIIPEKSAGFRKSDQQQLAALPPPDRPGGRNTATISGYLPVPGRIVRGFRSKNGGTPSDGITILSHPGATVITSQDGVVVFAGPFKGLGKLLIIEHRGAYHQLLAGLARIDAAVGENVLAGEPVGVLSTSGPAAPTLYLELRRKGHPVNPTPWLASRLHRKNG